MAIYTRFGSEVEIIGYNHNTGDTEVRYLSSGDVAYFGIYELKADNGIQEIDEAIKEV